MSSSSARRLLLAAAMIGSVLIVALVVTVVVTVLGGDDGEEAPGPTPVPTDRLAAPKTVEADADPSLPGEHIDLAGLYGGAYGDRPGTSAHVQDAVDYSVQGLPPAGGPHWGGATCGNDPTTAPPLCGPAPWGIYREPWAAETLVHNMEHAGVIVWYNTADRNVIDELEAFAQEGLNDDMMLVLAPYPDMAAETVAITVWGRRDTMAASELDVGRLQEFIDVLYCRFNPENFPCSPRSN